LVLACHLFEDYLSMALPHGQSSTRREPGAVARLSLEKKLPILGGGILLIVVIAVSIAAYVEVRRVSLDAANQRLESVTSQLRDALRNSGAQLRTTALLAAKQPDIVEFARSRDPRLRQRALDGIQYKGAQPGQVIAVELRDSTDAVILSTSPGPSGKLVTSATRRQSIAPDSAAVGLLQRLGDAIVYPAIAGIHDAPGVYLVQWRQLTATRQAREDAARLIGFDASLLIGNADGSQWTDLVEAAAAPQKTAHVQPVQGTPWVIAMDFPRAAVLAPVQSFVRWKIAFVVIALVVSLGATWIVSRRITRPLRELTEAARGLAAGGLERPPRIDRADEIGQLGDAFAVMASEVRESRRDLEAKVDERTRDLNAALEELHQAQETLVRRERLAILGQLAGGVGHELRNPLGVMTNAVYYLRMVLAGQPPNIHEYLGILQQQITLSEKIVSDLLDFARSKQPQRATVSLTEITAAQIERLGLTNGVRVDAHLPATVPPVFVDKVQIGQIVFNLLTNAVQAIDGSGVISVAAGVDDRSVYVDVTDSGNGVDPANIDRIFEPLFTTKARGIGLGLAVSRTLARANDGELTVTSPPGEGATFRLALPVANTGGAV
jgi:signal transduction histidine kinase